MLHMSRTYDTAEKAEHTLMRLKDEGFTADMLHVAESGRGSNEHHYAVTVDFPFGMGRRVTDILERFGPIESSYARRASHGTRDGGGVGGAGPAGYYGGGHAVRSTREPELETISRLSAPKPVGAISDLSRWKAPGAISQLSGPVNPGSIAKLSRRVNPGAISRLSAPKPVGAIRELSRPRRSETIARLSAGWELSSMLGIPLLTRSQAPVEPDSTLLVDTRRQTRR